MANAHKLLRALVIAVVAAACGIGLSMTTPARLLEGVLIDARLAFLAKPASAPFAIIAIDDAAIAAMRASVGPAGCACRTPLNKAYLAGLIEKLDAMGASRIGLDVLLDDWTRPEEKAVFLNTVRGMRAELVLLEGAAADVRAGAPKSVTWADATLGRIDEADGVLRRHEPHPGAVPSFAAALAGVSPTPGGHPILVGWRAPRGGERAYPVYPAAALAAAPADWIAGKIVLIGRLETDTAVPPLVEDQHMTPMRLRAPYAAGMAGVEAQAHVAETLMRQDAPQMASALAGGALTILAALIGLSFGRRLGDWAMALAVGAGHSIVWIAAALGLFAAFGLLIPVLAPLLAFTIAYVLANRALAGEINHDRAFIRRAFGQYLAPDVITDLLRAPGGPSIGATRRDISVLVSDVQGFSTLARTLEPERLAALMNAYFDGAIEVLWRHGAMIDKLVGDGVYAVFGAPRADTEHAGAALAAAKALDAFCESFRAEAPARFSVEFGRTRIGLESGEALVGNFGGRLRFDYTAYGDVVVRAARLQAANKAFDSRILIGEGAAQRLAFKGVEPFAMAAIAGTPAPVQTYRPTVG